MTIDLTSLSKVDNPMRAFNWLVDTYGPSGDRWTLKDLRYLEFRKDRDAALFLLVWAS